MAKQRWKDLPDELSYLRPFAKRLGKLRPEELNEDVDTEALDKVLRNRVRGLENRTAEEALITDATLLSEWLSSCGEEGHPAAWLKGYLLSPELHEHLTRPAEPPIDYPIITITIPDGWTHRLMSSRLDLRTGSVFAVITAINQVSFECSCDEARHPPFLLVSGGSRDVLEVTFGANVGVKIVSAVDQVPSFKKVIYFLRTGGGFAQVTMGHLKLLDFDESVIEDSLRTLSIDRPMVYE